MEIKPLNNEIAGEASFLHCWQNFVVKNRKLRTPITLHNQNLFKEVADLAPFHFALKELDGSNLTA